MRLKRETQGAFCVLNANANSQTRKSMKINVICTVHYILTYITYSHTLCTHIQYILTYITYPHTLHTTYIPYPRTFHIPVHSISPYIPYTRTFHIPVHSIAPYIPYITNSIWIPIIRIGPFWDFTAALIGYL